MGSGTLVVIAGPTGVGKTELCLTLAERWGCDVVNCDSRQIYRDLPVGTAAPTAAEQQRAGHWFVGTHSLSEDYNAGAYERDAVGLLARLKAEHRPDTPFALLSGGSMMYMDAVCYGLDDIPSVPADTRTRIQQDYAAKGISWLQSEVMRLDPDYWQQVDRHNPQRLIHCLEVTLHTGVPYSAFRRSQRAARPWRTLILGLQRPREELYERINTRVDMMMRNGLEEEARNALGKFPAGLPNSLKTVGYNEMAKFFCGEYTREEAVAMIKQNSRRYAKRQMTWLRAKKDIVWLDARLPEDCLVRQIEDIISNEEYGF